MRYTRLGAFWQLAMDKPDKQCQSKGNHIRKSPNYNRLIRYYTKPDIMDRYMLVILALMIGGMVIMASQQRWTIFYAMMGGAIVVIMYSSWRNRRQYKRKK